MSHRDLDSAKTQVMPPAGGAPMARGPMETDILDEDTAQPVSFRSLFSLGRTEPYPEASPDEPPRATAFSARYQPRGVLGEGGMGEVRLARDKVVGRDVAIKTMLPEVEEFARDRFLREARVQGQLEHPAIVPIYDLGLTEGQQLFFTMKRLRGESLDAVLERLAADDAETLAKYPLRRLLAAFVQVALAVEYAHSRGVLHRDLKPANVMLGDFGEVYVIDWGLARLRFSSDGDISGGPSPEVRSKGETLAGSVLGTPGYMAPEQAAGATDVLDGRADVYALGATLYEILAREPLHGQDSIQGLLRATLSGPSPPVEQRPSIERIPPELLGLLRRATAIEPKNRVPTARELADAVERFLDGERDEVRRRELADAHVARAQSLADAASTRIEALREVGRALALDPANTAALTLLRELFSLPEEDAGEALPELEALEHERRQGLLRVVRVRALAWLAAVPFFVAMGVTNVARLGVVAGLVAANAMLATVLARRPRVTDAMLRLSLVASTVCVTSFGLFYGPLILTPVYAVTNAIVYAMSGERRLRWEAIALSSAALVVPVLASLSGLDVTYYASNRVDGFTVWSPTLEVPLEATMAVLCAAFIATTITPSLLIGRMTQQLASAERRVALQAHRLRQLLPPS